MICLLVSIVVVKGKYHVRIYLKDFFGFAEHQEKGTFGFGYKLFLTRNTENAVLSKGNAVDDAKIKNNAIAWYVPNYTPSITQQNILMNQIIKKMATELQYPERSVFMKEVNTQIFWVFELGTQGVSIPVWIFTVFRRSDRDHDQNLNNDTFGGCQSLVLNI